MGVYLNSKKPYYLFGNEKAKPYFVDKSIMIKELMPLVREGSNYICITRPRRFGKTVMANMIAAFFGKAGSGGSLFEGLEAAKEENCGDYLNKYNVIYVTLSEIPKDCKAYGQYIDRIERRLLKDLRAAYPEHGQDEGEAVWDVLSDIYEAEEDVRFIFVLDEWDFIFHRDFVTDKDRESYINFLSNLLKDKPYVTMAYMTGILPIAKYSSGSELNMFSEYTMATREKYSSYFGFTDKEVDDLYGRYLEYTEEPKVSREGLRQWYDGYQTLTGERMYNPRSVVCALKDNQLSNYWTSSGPYDEIFYYIEKNVADVRDDMALMVSGISVPAKVQEFAATSMNLKTRDEIFSAMVVYGFLSYSNGKVLIPNKELMDKFTDMLRKEVSLGYIYRLAKESDRMLKATLSGDTDTMLDILEYAHDTEIPLLSYSNETDLAAVVNLVYLSARDSYRVEREDKAGTGYVDFIFYPETDKSADGIILELKVDHTPEAAIEQIKSRNYALRFKGKLGEEPKYTGRILAVGIAYNRKTKKHRCKVEVL